MGGVDEHNKLAPKSEDLKQIRASYFYDDSPNVIDEVKANLPPTLKGLYLVMVKREHPKFVEYFPEESVTDAILSLLPIAFNTQVPETPTPAANRALDAETSTRDQGPVFVI